MNRLTYVLRFERPPNSPSDAATAPGIVATTQIKAAGVSSTWKPIAGSEATLDLQYAVLGDGSWFAEWGTSDDGPWRSLLGYGARRARAWATIRRPEADRDAGRRGACTFCEYKRDAHLVLADCYDS